MEVTVGDWYRLTNPFPDDARLIKRRDAAGRLGAKLTTARPQDALDFAALALEAVGLPCCGENAALQRVLAEILIDEPGLDARRAGTTLDPRICSAVALDGFIRTDPRTVRRWSTATLVATAIACALRNRPITAGAIAAELAGSLLGAAEGILDGMDERRRTRAHRITSRIEDVDATAPDAVEKLKAQMAQMASDQARDREELQALWWIFGGRSVRTRRLFREFKPGTVALLAGVEMAEIVAPPPTAGMAALASRAASSAANDGQRMRLVDLLAQATPEAWEALRTATGAEPVRRNPAMFPISSVAFALAAGQELQAASRVIGTFEGDAEFAHEDLAAQVFSECALAAGTRAH